MPELTLMSFIDTAQLIDQIRALSYDEILEFLEDLDDSIGDWDFTRAAYEYFEKQMMLLEEEKADEFLASRSFGS